MTPDQFSELARKDQPRKGLRCSTNFALIDSFRCIKSLSRQLSRQHNQLDSL